MVEFQARFSGVAQQISIPIANISAIYARETGHGMAFDVSKAIAAEEGEDGEGPETRRCRQCRRGRMTRRRRQRGDRRGGNGRSAA